MRKAAALISALLLLLLLCACASSGDPAAETTAETTAPVPCETSGVTGFKTGNSIRFDTFGLTMNLPEAAAESWETGEIPATFAELDNLLAAEEVCGIGGAGFETASGSANIYIQVMPCEEGTRNIYVMEYFLENFPKENSVKHAEIKEFSLGDYPWLDVFLAEKEDGTNVLLFDRVSGLYRIECVVETYGYQGAEALAKEIFYIDAPAAEERFETSGTVGHLQADQLRFEDYGVSLLVDSEELFDICRQRPMPQRFDAMPAYFVDDWYQLIWQDFEDEQGRWSVSVSLSPLSPGVTEDSKLYYTGEYFKETFETSQCEIISLALGENETQQCLLVTFRNDDGAEENLLHIAKLNGDYCLECSVSTYDYQGAIEKTEALFRVDAPKPLPFTIGENGLLILTDRSIIGKTLQELHDIIGPFASPAEFPWWGDELTYFNVDCDGYPVSMLIDKEGKLFGVICEKVEGTKFDTAFKDLTALQDIYFYLDASENDFLLHDKMFRFYLDDDIRFDFARCDNGNGGAALCQRYLADPITDDVIIDMANYIASGVLPALPKEHAAHLAEFVEKRCGGSEMVTDLDTCIGIANFYLAMNDYASALKWGDAIIRINGRGLSGRTAALLNGYLVSKSGSFTQSDLPTDYDRAAEYYFLAMGSADPGLKSEAESALVTLWFNDSEELSEETLQEVEAAVIRITQENPNQFIPQVYKRVDALLASD